jgi:hypothetical protein
VLGPAIANDDLGGAAAWGLILTAESIGLIVGGVILLRLRPQRLLLTATLGVLLTMPFLLGLAGPMPVVVPMQQEIPQEKLSRVYSYDALGSWVLIPLGLAVAGPIAELIGTRETILAATAISLSATLAVLFVPDVRTITRRAD